ncbi:MAG: type IX secretion system membrane protein PorP/SprF [Bacteroidetes bacterium]|nr:type IX secretion system membrane protein PorP/SprF [Bacteroidota bacterium]
MKKIILSLFLLAGAFESMSQQDPLYSQYFNNPMLINPAFAGSNERLYAGVAYRSQWSGIEGGPTTFNFNGHIALVDNKVGLGLMVVQDQLGDIKNTQYSTSYSYRIKLKNTTSFAFGMQTGFTRYATDPNGVRVLNPDPLFATFTETKFNTGVGVLLQNDRYTLSLSVPRLLPGTVSQGGQSIQVYSQNYYLYGSYLFYVNERVQFKPSALLRVTSGTPLSADINCNFVINKLYTAGVFTRKFNTYGALLQMVMNNYRFGYVFELPGKGSALNYNTHEISLSLSLDVLRSHNHSSPGF